MPEFRLQAAAVAKLKRAGVFPVSAIAPKRRSFQTNARGFADEKDAVVDVQATPPGDALRSLKLRCYCRLKTEL